MLAIYLFVICLSLDFILGSQPLVAIKMCVIYTDNFSFVNAQEKFPIRTIDLRDVSSVVADSSQNKENAFK